MLEYRTWVWLVSRSLHNTYYLVNSTPMGSGVQIVKLQVELNSGFNKKYWRALQFYSWNIIYILRTENFIEANVKVILSIYLVFL